MQHQRKALDFNAFILKGNTQLHKIQWEHLTQNNTFRNTWVHMGTAASFTIICHVLLCLDWSFSPDVCVWRLCASSVPTLASNICYSTQTASKCYVYMLRGTEEAFIYSICLRVRKQTRPWHSHHEKPQEMGALMDGLNGKYCILITFLNN